MTEQSDLPATGRSGHAAASEASVRAAAPAPAAAATAKPRRRRKAAGNGTAPAATDSGPTAAGEPASGTTARRKRTAAAGMARTARRKGEPDTIYLPALPTVLDSAKRAGKSRRRGRAEPGPDAASPAAVPAPSAPAPQIAADPAPQPSAAGPSPAADEYLPEYRSQTNGLRELLSSIDPLDDGYAPIAALPQFPSIEDGMHIPYNRPGIPGSPDLPVSPVRYLHYVGNALLAAVLMAFAGLLYSHFVSPTGINWSALQEGAGKAASWTASRVAGSAETAPVAAAPELAAPAVRPADTTIASTPRISTTAATARVDLRQDTPAYADLNLSADELERRIRELEQEQPAAAPTPAPAAAAADAPGHHSDSARSAAPDLDPAAVLALRAASIDPAMEQQIFARAKAYLRQRDIASARMILNYAASLGSGIAAMALAETFDPAYLTRINLQQVDADLPEARKWYKTASSLGVSEADARLAALK